MKKNQKANQPLNPDNSDHITNEDKQLQGQIDQQDGQDCQWTFSEWLFDFSLFYSI